MTARAGHLSGTPGGLLGAALHQVEGVEAGAQLVAHDEVGERVVLGRETGVAVAECWAFAMSSSARYASRRRAAQLQVHQAAGLLDDGLSQASTASWPGPRRP